MCIANSEVITGYRNLPVDLTRLMRLTVKPIVELLPVILEPLDVDIGPLQSLLHGQRG